MKKLILIFTLCAATLPAAAQDTEVTLIDIVDSVGRGIVTITEEGKEERIFSIRVGDLKIDFQNRDREKRSDTVSYIRNSVSPHGNSPYRRRHIRTMLAPYAQIGFNGLTGPGHFGAIDYSGYPPDEVGFLDIRTERSLSVEVGVGGVRIPITQRSRAVSLNSAIGIKWNNYFFSRDITIETIGDRVHPVGLAPGYRKSKFSTLSLTAPVMVEIGGWNMSLSAGVYGDMLLTQHTKIKNPRTKDHSDMGIRTFKAGVVARLNFEDFYIYGDYALTPMFRPGAGPRTRQFTIGAGFTINSDWRK